MELTIPIKVEFNEKDFKKMMDEYIKTHDVVEVVRCGDCIWYVRGFCKKLESINGTTRFQVKVKKNDFCSDGEVYNE